jgi:hypothetical protein
MPWPAHGRWPEVPASESGAGTSGVCRRGSVFLPGVACALVPPALAVVMQPAELMRVMVQPVRSSGEQAAAALWSTTVLPAHSSLRMSSGPEAQTCRASGGEFRSGTTDELVNPPQARNARLPDRDSIAPGAGSWVPSAPRRNYHHRAVGNLTLDCDIWIGLDGSGQRLMVLTAEPGSPSHDALRILASGPPCRPQGRTRHHRESRTGDLP